MIENVSAIGSVRRPQLHHHVAETAAKARAVPPAPDCEAELLDALASLKRKLADADAEALRSRGEVPDATSTHIRQEFQAFVRLLNRVIGDDSPLPPQRLDDLRPRMQSELLPFVLLSEKLERSYAKPRGYAGDFFTIHRIYEEHSVGVGRLGPLLDRCFLDIPTVVAARNRRALLAREIRRELAAHPERPVAVTSLACGPAQELFDVFSELADPGRLRATGVDIDFQALAFVADRRDQAGLGKQFRLEQGNLVRLALGREKLELDPQDFVYSIGLIDYFEDDFVVRLLNCVHGLLAPGGRVILGNFHPRNPGKAMADHILDWKLLHRTEDDMNRLFARSAFGRPCTRIVFEEEGINLFAECVKHAEREEAR